MDATPYMRLQALREAHKLTETAHQLLRDGDPTGARVAIEHAKRLRSLNFRTVA